MSSKLVRFSPALKSVLAVVVLVVVVLALSWGAGQGTPASQAVVHSMSWLLWRVTASASVLLFLIVLLRGIAELRHEWNAGDTAQHAQIVVYVLLAVVFVTIGVGAVTQASGTAFSHMPRLPVTRLDVRAGVLVIVGAVAAIPWLAMVWLIHSASRDVRAEIEATAAAAVAPETSGESPLLPAFRRLAVLWEAIVRCALALSVLVVATILTTGALRGVYIEASPVTEGQPDWYPSVYVLLYGATFAFLLLILMVPMLAYWRTSAARLVEAAIPVPTGLRFEEGWDGQRKHLERLLHLDVSLLGSPLTMLTALAPLVSSALAAFIPELAM
ncbi:hypothetical protein ACFWYW_10710 [Nonomuraea sp. NPDC059023]|uniref:hypothetical protein n=1 Tax=unclassified Nonomuraea TaxID=2593643 RepID=UPI0036C9ABDC